MSPESPQSTVGLAAAAVAAQPETEITPAEPGRSPLEQHFAAAVRAMAPAGDGAALADADPADAAALARLADGDRPGPLTGPLTSPLPTPLTVVGADAAGGRLTPARCLELFDAQLASRHLDLAAGELRTSGAGFYTIGSSGHEGNAGVAAALRLTDPALLHYRSGAFYLVRAAQADPPRDGVTDVLLGMVAASAEPMAGGRHKVFGHRDLNIIPQTSTIASHLPRAVGLAFALGRAAKLAPRDPFPGDAGMSDRRASYPGDAVVVCSFGDASMNHSTAAGAFNTAAYCAYQGLPMPLLFVCEDNGLGISVRTPPGWVTAARSGHGVLPYFHADGCDVAAVHDTALAAASWVRERRQPAFLHLAMVRYGGHAGSDVESSYRSAADIAADADRDPLLRTARLLIQAGVLTPEQVLDRYEESRRRVLGRAAEIAGAPRLTTAAEVMAPLAPRRPHAVAASLAVASRTAGDWARRRAFEGRLPEDQGPLTLAQAINRALADELAARPGMIVFGEDVARKGGVYGVTRGLLRAFGAGRVFDSVLDEQSILGLALGAGLAGLLPVPEIQYLAYLHNAADQIRGEAATLSFFSQGQYRNPMVVRIAGLAYQKGFGGHFHNDNSLAALRDIPGLVIACPARPDDAPAMLRTCLAAAEADGAVSVFLEPIALYHERDLHQAGDEGWLARYDPPAAWAAGHVPIGRARLYGDGTDLTIATFGNGLRMCLRAARRLYADGIRCRVLDLRWLAPLPVEDLLREASVTGRVLVADETRRTGGVSEGVISALADAGFIGRVGRVASEDSFIPLGDAANAVLLSEAAIESAAWDVMR
jgi:2-oxoisovalerate dehydrogenase E1 component